MNGEESKAKVVAMVNKDKKVDNRPRASQIAGVPGVHIIHLVPFKSYETDIEDIFTPYGVFAGYVVRKSGIIPFQPIILPSMKSSCINLVIEATDYMEEDDGQPTFANFQGIYTNKRFTSSATNLSGLVEANGNWIRLPINPDTVESTNVFPVALSITLPGDEDKEEWTNEQVRAVMIRGCWLEFPVA